MLKKSIMMSVALAVVMLSGPQAASFSKEKQHPVREMVKRLELGKPVSHGNLTIIPIHMDRVLDGTSYSTLEDALEKGWITMTEVEGGRVPQVKISNTSRHLIFLFLLRRKIMGLFRNLPAKMRSLPDEKRNPFVYHCVYTSEKIYSITGP